MILKRISAAVTGLTLNQGRRGSPWKGFTVIEASVKTP